VAEFSEDELIRRAKAGDAEAFCQIARAYNRRVHMLALHYCRDAHDAEDLSQEVWLKAFKALHTFRGESTFFTWLRRIMINSFLNYHRAPRLRLVIPAMREVPKDCDALDMVEHLSLADGPNVEVATDRKMLVERVMSALKELTPQQRMIFLLKHQEGLTYVEIAEILGCSVGTIKKSLFRAIGKIREALGVEIVEREFEVYAAGEK
jgi:RNA polymerase sigma-70 factor (ECF subfamily)